MKLSASSLRRIVREELRRENQKLHELQASRDKTGRQDKRAAVKTMRDEKKNALKLIDDKIKSGEISREEVKQMRKDARRKAKLDLKANMALIDREVAQRRLTAAEAEERAADMATDFVQPENTIMGALEREAAAEELEAKAAAMGAAATASVDIPTVLLKTGSKGSDVKKLQMWLTKAGYEPEGGADGDFGSGTYVAVRAFQDEQNLNVDGKVGENTWKALAAQQGERSALGADIGKDMAGSLGHDFGVATESRLSKRGLRRIILKEIRRYLQ